jgi:hypothetical protein
VSAATGTCTLRAALVEADAAGAAAVVVPAGTYSLQTADTTDGDPDLDIAADVHLNRGTPRNVRIPASQTAIDIAPCGRLRRPDVDRDRPAARWRPARPEPGRGTSPPPQGGDGSGVGREGFEPPTPCASCRCSSQLS